MTKVQVDSNGKVITLGGKALVASEGGSATLITKNITENGTYNASSDNADGYSSVTVNVAGTTPTGTLSITANGVYDVTNYASANVSVAGGGGENSVTRGVIAFYNSEYGTVYVDYSWYLLYEETDPGVYTMTTSNSPFPYVLYAQGLPDFDTMSKEDIVNKYSNFWVLFDITPPYELYMPGDYSNPFIEADILSELEVTFEDY